MNGESGKGAKLFLKSRNDTVRILLLISFSILLMMVIGFQNKVKTIPKETVDNYSYNHTFQHAYSLWFQPPNPIMQVHQQETELLSRMFSGPNHSPHITLYGAVYTTSESYVLNVARDIQQALSKMGPLEMVPSYVKVRGINDPRLRWRSSISMRYEQKKELMKAMKYAAKAFNKTDFQYPHSSLIYDFDGNCAKDPKINQTIWDRMHHNRWSTSLTWIADAFHVVYTPLRPNFKSQEDMTEMVKQWRVVASFPIRKGLDKEKKN